MTSPDAKMSVNVSELRSNVTFFGFDSGVSIFVTASLVNLDPTT